MVTINATWWQYVTDRDQDDRSALWRRLTDVCRVWRLGKLRFVVIDISQVDGDVGVTGPSLRCLCLMRNQLQRRVGRDKSFLILKLTKVKKGDIIVHGH